MRNLAVAHIRTVKPYIEAAVNALKIQECLRCVGIHSIIKLKNILTAGIFLRHVRRVYRERIFHIGILMIVKPVSLPHSRNRNYVKVLRIISQLIERFLGIIDTLKITEAPLSGKKLQSVRACTVFNQILNSSGCGDVIGPVGHCVLMENAQILIMPWNNHG